MNDDDFISEAERHAQIMQEGETFFSRLFLGCVGIALLAVGIAIFFLLKFHPFWKYP